MSTTRASRAATASLENASLLTARERLLVAQAVYTHGSDAWPAVSTLLSKHPLITRPAGFFSPQACKAIYRHLMDDAGFESSEENKIPHARLHLRLAQKHYQARVVELRDLILAEEQKFKSLATEIEDIKAGRWDEKLVEGAGKQSLSLPDDIVSGDLTTDDKHSTTSLSSLETATLEPQSTRVNESIDQEASADEPMELSEEDNMMEDATPLPANLTLVPEDIQSQRSSPCDRSQSAPINEISDAHRDGPGHSSTPTMPITGVRVVQDVVEESNSAHQLRERSKTSDEARSPREQNAAEALQELRASFPAPVQSPRRLSTPEETIAKAESPASNHALELRDTAEPVTAPSSPATPVFKRISTQGKRKASEADLDSVKDAKKARDMSVISEDNEFGFGRRRSRASFAPSTPATKRFQNVILFLHNQVYNHRNGGIFHNPIRPTEAHDYPDLVKRPMDLKTLKGRVKDGTITSSDDYQRDLYLMFANAVMYNRPSSDVHQMVQEVILDSEKFIQEFRRTEGFIS